jgi:hypothetical protein
MDEDGYELELGSSEGRGSDRNVISEIKTTDLPFTSDAGWSNHRYIGALIGKSVRAARGAYEYTHGRDSGLGNIVEGLEPKGDE